MELNQELVDAIAELFSKHASDEMMFVVCIGEDPDSLMAGPMLEFMDRTRKAVDVNAAYIQIAKQLESEGFIMPNAKVIGNGVSDMIQKYGHDLLGVQIRILMPDDGDIRQLPLKFHDKRSNENEG